MDNKISKLLTSLSKASSIDKIHVTEEQLNTLEALVVGYMSIIRMGLIAEDERLALKIADSLWDDIFTKGEQ